MPAPLPPRLREFLKGWAVTAPSDENHFCVALAMVAVADNLSLTSEPLRREALEFARGAWAAALDRSETDDAAELMDVLFNPLDDEIARAEHGFREALITDFARWACEAGFPASSVTA